MPATGQDARIKHGASYTLRIPVKDKAGNPVDLTGRDLHYRIAARADQEPALLSIDSPAITVEGDTNDVAVIPLSVANTLTLLPAGRTEIKRHQELFETDGAVKNVLTVGTLTVAAAQVAFHS